MKNDMVVLRVPRDSWKVLRETLERDSESKAFDEDLRRSIFRSLREVREVGAPFILVEVFGGVPSKVEVFWEKGKALRAARRRFKSLRRDYDALVLTQKGDTLYSWPEE